ncbi:MAG: hypothetical protein CL927_06980 [Deltaproteobacteria bacterium]|nr:hypothetical protein [Deltaproteobacteria bacterium]HCH61919.1 hypothetical protein [Deltaproteobacteria bacterium]
MADSLTLPSASVSLGRRVSVWCLTMYCGFLVVMGLPVELGPRALHAVTTPVRDVLDDYGYNPWHFVFPGRRGLNKRRNFAVRYTGITSQGERVVLHEAPPGLTGPAMRILDDARTTASIKIFGLTEGGALMLRRSDERWALTVERIRRQGTPKRSVLGFCSSDTLNGGRDLSAVELDLFAAGIAYESGEQYGRGVRLLRANCDAQTVSPLDGDADNRPEWPGVEWLAVP